MDWPRLLFAIGVLTAGTVMIAFNAMVFWLTVVRKEEAPSVAPIFGGIVGAVGIALLPLSGSWKWAWIPLVADWGGPLGLLVAWLLSRSSTQKGGT